MTSRQTRGELNEQLGCPGRNNEHAHRVGRPSRRRRPRNPGTLLPDHQLRSHKHEHAGDGASDLNKGRMSVAVPQAASDATPRHSPSGRAYSNSTSRRLEAMTRSPASPCLLRGASRITTSSPLFATADARLEQTVRKRTYATYTDGLRCTPVDYSARALGQYAAPPGALPCLEEGPNARVRSAKARNTRAPAALFEAQAGN